MLAHLKINKFPFGTKWKVINLSAQKLKHSTVYPRDERPCHYNFQIYTDQQHWLNGGNTRTHLYNTMENFLYQCYGKITQREKDEAEMSEKDDEVDE